ncbi:hypothetical protein [Brevundimonas halotolerans]|uniref:Uncharacterized protein n=1 Tax=Brevundimonas halotolerans TaxID=69670 RepID=A0A7W9A286_9CAUL|nr:hypothetical protein [Brevundimonas halotolerans]MBB5660094.1 hypothetical protein [Brevundimonas halotolerans]
MYERLWVCIALMMVSGCIALEPPVDLPPLSADIDEVHVVARVHCTEPRLGSGNLCHVISDPDRIAAIRAFIDARPDGWSTPFGGAPIHPVRIEMYREGKLIESVGFSQASVERGMFLSRRVDDAEVDQLLSLIGLDRSHLRFARDALKRSDGDTSILMASVDHVWWASIEGRQGRLSYFIPETDDVIADLSCVRRSGLISASVFLSDRESDVIEAQAGEAVSLWAVQTESNEPISDAVVLTATHVPMSDPVMTAFRRTQSIAFQRQQALSPRLPAEEREIERFFVFCQP